MSDSNVFVDGEPLDIGKLNLMRSDLTTLTATVAATAATVSNSTTNKQFIAYPGSVRNLSLPDKAVKSVPLKYSDAGFSAGTDVPRIMVTPVFNGGNNENNLQYYVDNASVTNTQCTLYYYCIGKFTGNLGFDYLAVGMK